MKRYIVEREIVDRWTTAIDRDTGPVYIGESLDDAIRAATKGSRDDQLCYDWRVREETIYEISR